MKRKRYTGMLLAVVGFAFLVLAFGRTPRNSAYLGAGVALVIAGSMLMRRARRA